MIIISDGGIPPVTKFNHCGLAIARCYRPKLTGRALAHISQEKPDLFRDWRTQCIVATYQGSPLAQNISLNLGNIVSRQWAANLRSSTWWSEMINECSHGNHQRRHRKDYGAPKFHSCVECAEQLK